jgi:hypothetical protein
LQFRRAIIDRSGDPRLGKGRCPYTAFRPCIIIVFNLHEDAMSRNITFAADETLIDEARAVARAENTTLNEQFGLWLEQYARKRRAARAMETVDRMRRYVRTGGRKFTRDEMNER